MDLFSTNYMNAVVNDLNVVPSFLVDFFFPGVQTEESEEIHFDVTTKNRRLAPFVSPVVEGKVLVDAGYVTKTFKPAYIKMKTPWDPNKALRRLPGERIGGSSTPQERTMRRVGQYLLEHREMIDNRLEWMASQIVQTGSVTISGDHYQTVVVDFGRHNDLTVTLGGGVKWSDATTDPVANLQTWATLMQTNGGDYGTDVIMGTGAWIYFKGSTFTKDIISRQRTLGEMPSLSERGAGPVGANYQGSVGEFNIFTYVGDYVDDNGAVQPMFPTYGVAMRGQPMGYRAFGAIRDLQSLQAVPYFAKSWEDQDPSLRWIMTQSAPLLVPYRPNGTLYATVHS
jgi:hypothetical protein